MTRPWLCRRPWRHVRRQAVETSEGGCGKWGWGSHPNCGWCAGVVGGGGAEDLELY